MGEKKFNIFGLLVYVNFLVFFVWRKLKKALLCPFLYTVVLAVLYTFRWHFVMKSSCWNRNLKCVFINGDKKNVANYRPISILSSFSKILEKIMYIRLMNHLETNNILAAEQFGFRTSFSTEQASFNFINNILNELKKK